MEVIAHNDFMELSKSIAKDFLHTAVFVDEQAYFIKQEQPKILISPSKGQTVKRDSFLSISSLDPSSHELDAKKVIDTFAAEGIICSVIRPADDEDLMSGQTKKAMLRADALILDWDLYGDKGDTALEIIKFLLSSDAKDKSRLRLIIIYSAETDIVGISDRVSEFFVGLSFERDGDLTHIKGHTRISVYAKEHVSVADQYKSRVLKIEQFPDCLAYELSQVAAGLVSNVALKSISTLRKNTHSIIGLLGKEVDPAYLSHRALLPNPDDAMDHLIDILASEFHSVLENNSVGTAANIDTIAAYLTNWFKDGLEVKLLFGDNDEKISLEDLINIETKGFLNSDWLETYVKKNHTTWSTDRIDNEKRKLENNIGKNLTKTFTIMDESAVISDYKLSSITSLKKRNGYLESAPILTQGTILKETDSSDKFWLCILPKCDCVRIEGERTFLFLPLEVVEGNKKFHFVTEVEAGTFVKLKIDYSTYGLTGHNFKPNSSDSIVRAQNESSLYYFTSKDKKFKWICELKTGQAQRISNEFAGKLSRVGLDEFEWQRRWAGSN